ncbi:MAG TPA: hypothetical protein V6D15_04375 [Oculatellaceae cyanobacterium]|jgi:hypothetical protein
MRSVTKKIIPTIVLFIFSSLVVSCSNPDNNVSRTTQINPNNSAPTNLNEQSQTNKRSTTDELNQSKTAAPDKVISQKKRSTSTVAQADKTQEVATKNPKVGTVKEIVQGDLMCYVTLTDQAGKKHNLGASFEICANTEKFLNKKVSLVYEIASVNDCESNEPCGKSKQELLITKMEVISDTSPTSSNSGNSQTLSNGEWTITIGNRNSWSGVNGTGNLSYNSCNSEGKCLKLTGGRITCRDGKCLTDWQNGDYYYIVEQPIVEKPANSEDIASSTTLTVRKGGNVLMNVRGFKAVS